jgi:hypothetical protein
MDESRDLAQIMAGKNYGRYPSTAPVWRAARNPGLARQFS